MVYNLPKFFAVLVTVINVATKDCAALTPQEAVANFFQYFKVGEPVGIPVLNLDEPLELFSPLETVPVTLWNGSVYGHSKIKVLRGFVDFISLTGEVSISAPDLEVKGNFTWPGFYYTSEGLMRVSLKNVSAFSNFSMFIDEKHELSITDIEIEQESDYVDIELTNLILEHQLVMNSGVLNIFFDDILLSFIDQLRPFLMSEMNNEISKFIATLPEVKSFLGPEDLKELELAGPKESKTFKVLFKRLVEFLGKEPLKLPDQNFDTFVAKFKTTDMVLHGVSNVDTLHSMNILYEEKQFFIEASMTYPVLFLYYNIVIEKGKFLKWKIFQKVQLNEVFFKVRLVFDPSLKTSPKIPYLDIDVDSFGRLESKKKTFFGRAIRFISKLDDKILNSVVSALKKPIRKNLQKELEDLDIEKEVIRLFDQN